MQNRLRQFYNDLTIITQVPSLSGKVPHSVVEIFKGLRDEVLADNEQSRALYTVEGPVFYHELLIMSGQILSTTETETGAFLNLL